MLAPRLRAALRLAAALTLAAAAAGQPGGSPAHAQSTDALNKARERFREGLALEAGGNYAQALTVFKEIAEVKSTPQVRMHIAQCEEKTGDYVKALGSYRLALVDAQEQKLKVVIKAANESIAALEPKIPSLTVQRGEGAKVASINLDQRALGATEIGKGLPVNPGPHVIEASASGRRPFRAELSLGDGEKKTVNVVLDPAEEGASAPTGEPTTEPTAAPSGTAQASSPVRTAGFVIGALGLVGLGVAGAFIGLRQDALGQLETKCGKDHKTCPPDATSIVQQGELDSTVATGALIGGGAAFAVGLIMVLVAPKPAAPATSGLRMTPWVAGSRRGASLSFQF